MQAAVCIFSKFAGSVQPMLFYRYYMMNQELAQAIFFTAIVIYVVRSLLFGYGAFLERRRSRRPLSPSHLPSVSVVIPARNEEHNIELCVRSVMANTYGGTFEVVVVNDRSTDRTGEILARLQREFPSLLVHNTVEAAADEVLRGKPRALDQGIAVSHGEVVMMTDADCVVEAGWIQTIAGVFSDEKVGLVPSFTVIEAGSLFERLQALEWIFNHTLASAGVGLRQPVGCFGNNLSIRRRVYDELGGYRSIRFSVTEDLALLQAVAATSWKILYPCSYEARVVTLPVKSFGSFIRQHQRWAKGGQALGWRATIFVISSAALWLAVVTAIVSGQWLWLAILLAGRILLDFIIISPSLRILRVNDLQVCFPLAVPFFMLIEFVVPFFLLKRSVVWKGQTFR